MGADLSMSLSQQFFEWGEGIMGQLAGGSLNTALDRSPAEWGNRSTHLLVESDSRSCELSVWDSGDAEYFVADSDGFVPTHLDIAGPADARAVIGRFVEEASRVAGRALRI